ncbi:MAG: hypothetical protein SFV32_08330 [Opitutaceae bacterium]|nr:hypothetical protein [Opitutaceae bacterium]
MSLINEALKKAQRERDKAPANPDQTFGGEGGNTPPSPGGDRGGNGSGPNWGLIIIIIVLFSVISILVTLLITSRKAESPVVAAGPTPTPQPAATASVPTPSPAPLVAPAAAAPALVQPAKIQPLITATSPGTTLSPVVPSVSEERTRRQSLVDQLRISGVRITERGNRALVNDRLVRVGDPLEAIPGLKVLEIERERIVLTDESGHRFVKRIQ